MAVHFAVGQINFFWKWVFYHLLLVENELCSSSKKATKKSPYAMYGFSTYEAPSMIICSVAEMNATTPSTELQSYKNLGVSGKKNKISLH